MSLKQHMLCALLVFASSTAAWAANDGVHNPAADTTQGAIPATPQAGTNPQTGAPACRQAKGKSRPQLTA